MYPVGREAGRSALRNSALERKHSQELQNLLQLPQPVRLWCLYPWLAVLWPQSLTAGGTRSAWRFLCQASSIHRFIVLYKLEIFFSYYFSKIFLFPHPLFIPSLHFLLGSAFKIISICSVTIFPPAMSSLLLILPTLFATSLSHLRTSDLSLWNSSHWTLWGTKGIPEAERN